jgi:hypothetical protein
VDIAEAHVGRLQTQLQQWGKKLDDLAAQVATDGWRGNLDYHKDIDELNAKYHTAQTRFVEFKTAGSAKWWGFKASVDHAWNDVEGAFAKLGSPA